MADPPVHRIDVRAFRYATEVPERVEAALETVVPALGDEEGPAVRVTATEGHFGHPIDVYEVTLEDRDAIEGSLSGLEASSALERVLDELESRVTDDCELFVRLDKQRAYADGVAVLGTGIELRIKLEAYPAKPATAIGNLRDYVEARGLRS
ncbi:MAG: RNA-binding domain-containing protein [Halobacteriota archaeon]